MSGNSDDPASGDDGDEPRAKDLAATPSALPGPEGPLDPATMMQLAKWFDLPSFDQVAEQEEAAREEADKRTDTQRILDTRAKAMSSIEPWFLAGLEGRRAAGVLTRITTHELRWETRMLAFDDSQVPAAFDLEDLPEVHIPPGLLKDLKACTPQAFLRDLHRPDKEFYIRLEPAFEDAGEPEAPDPMGPIRETLRTDYRVGVVAPAISTMSAGIADLRTILARPWAESKRERARAREAELLGKEAASKAVSTVPEGTP